MPSSNPEIPAEMLQGGRSADQQFDPQERLFYRLEEFYEIGSHPSGLSVRNPDFSVNREKHDGRPGYVLIPDWMHCGIAVFRCRDLPSEMESEGNVKYFWKAIHVPETRNYHHSEVHTLKAGSIVTKQSQVSKLLYREFRQRLSESMVVIKAFQKLE